MPLNTDFGIRYSPLYVPRFACGHKRRTRDADDMQSRVCTPTAALFVPPRPGREGCRQCTTSHRITCLQARRTTTCTTSTIATTTTPLHALHATRSVRVLLHMLVIVWFRRCGVCTVDLHRVHLRSLLRYSRSTQQAGSGLLCPITRTPPCCSTGGCWRGRSHGRCRWIGPPRQHL